MPPPVGCEGSNKELVEEGAVTPLAGRHVASCLRLLDVKGPTQSLRKATMSPLAGGHVMSCLHLLDVKDPPKNLWNMSVPHHVLGEMLCHASAYWM